jgi:hypothetical protein
MVRSATAFLLCAAVLASCDRTDMNALDVHGTVRDDRTGAPIAGARCLLERQTVSAGLWVDTWETVGDLETGADGTFALPFERAQAIRYRLTVERSAHAPHVHEWSADVFYETPLLAYDVALSALGELVFRCVRIPGTEPGASLFVRPTSTADLLPGCPPNAVEVRENLPDTAWSCTFRGDRFIPYAHRIGSGPESVDSVWVPAFGTAEALISW